MSKTKEILTAKKSEIATVIAGIVIIVQFFGLKIPGEYVSLLVDVVCGGLVGFGILSIKSKNDIKKEKDKLRL